MKCAHTRQRMTNNNNKNKKKDTKFDTSEAFQSSPTIPVCFPTQQPLL